MHGLDEATVVWQMLRKDFPGGCGERKLTPQTSLPVFFREEKHSIQVLSRASWCGEVCPSPWTSSKVPSSPNLSVILWSCEIGMGSVDAGFSHTVLNMGKLAQIWQTLCACFPRKCVFLFILIYSSSFSANGVADFQVFGHTEIIKAWDMFQEEGFWSHTFCF